eukprot:scaffold85009_cov63-Phaeocystis_antarctica.AAC.2
MAKSAAPKTNLATAFKNRWPEAHHGRGSCCLQAEVSPRPRSAGNQICYLKGGVYRTSGGSSSSRSCRSEPGCVARAWRSLASTSASRAGKSSACALVVR